MSKQRFTQEEKERIVNEGEQEKYRESYFKY